MKIQLPCTPDCFLFADNDETAQVIDLSELKECPPSKTLKISAAVNGYWSSDVIHMTFHRRTRDHSWETYLSHSSGGRLSSYGENVPRARVPIADDLVAEAGFGRALSHMAAFGEILRSLLNAREDTP